MKIYKNEKGITLVALAITILILALLAGVGIYQGTKGIDTAKNSRLMSEAGMVQHAVLEQYVKYKTTKNQMYLIGTKIDKNTVQQIATQMGISLVNIPEEYSNADYYKLTTTDVAKLGFKNVKDEFIVNYVSGEVINITNKTDSKGNRVYIKGDTFANQ